MNSRRSSRIFGGDEKWWAVYELWWALQRLWLSPIAHFPGPKLAALTMWYEFHYDSFLEGQYTFRIAEMHRKYGPISLHLTGMFGAPASAFGTVDHRRHRIRRQPMNPYFSQQRIRQLEPMLRDMVDKLHTPLHMYHPFNAFTTDVVVEYTMGDSFHYLDDHNGIQFKQFRWFISLFELLPRWLIMSINPDIGPVIDQKNESMRLANLVIDSKRLGSISTSDRASVPKGTLFHALLDSTLPPEEKTADRLSQEVFTVMAAGGETTARNLATITFHLLNNPGKLEKLREELNRLDPDGTASIVEYEAMPYLTSVMLEGLRITNAVATRLQRSSPDQPMRYKDWIIPPRVPVGITSLFVHHNEDIIPDSQSFIPERWMDPVQRKRLEKYLVVFSKGSRQCIGIPLAKAEILLVVARAFREFDMELYKTTIDDVRIVRDMFNGHPRKGSQGVRVIVKEWNGRPGLSDYSREQ
ncbi:cytochrome P450 [Aspergillus parasiticus]|uniref:Cytochrome P450 n=1 Tax=Aspergillus parasiticus TaxID=5067 RepID=A0A5N6DPL6_ASPPA|nr:cytochrome P450 [Aspergillus parasiticus]